MGSVYTETAFVIDIMTVVIIVMSLANFADHTQLKLFQATRLEKAAKVFSK